MFVSSKWLSSEEISSKDVELKVEVCEPAGSRNDMWQKQGRKSAEVWEKNSLSKPQEIHHNSFNDGKNDWSKIKYLVRKLQEIAKEIYAAMFFFPAKR